MADPGFEPPTSCVVGQRGYHYTTNPLLPTPLNPTLMELFKILKERKPISLAELFQLSQRSSSQAIRIPKHNLELFKHNFVYNGSHLWNGIIKKVFEKCTPSENNIMIPGSNKFSDLSMPISIFKQRLKKILIETQKMSIPGRPKEWMPHNNWAPYPPTLLPI